MAQADTKATVVEIATFDFAKGVTAEFMGKMDVSTMAMTRYALTK